MNGQTWEKTTPKIDMIDSMSHQELKQFVKYMQKIMQEQSDTLYIIKNEIKQLEIRSLKIKPEGH